MIPNFDFEPRQWQNSPQTARKSYSILNEFYSNICLGTRSLTAFHEGFCSVEELVQEPEEEQKV